MVERCRSAEAVAAPELAERRERNFAAGQRPTCAPHLQLSASNALQENMVVTYNCCCSTVISLAPHGIMIVHALSCRRVAMSLCKVNAFRKC